MSPTQFALIKSFVLPPGIFLFAFIMSFLFFFKNKKLFFIILIVSIFLLYLLSTPLVSRSLASIVESYDVINLNQLDKSKSTVIVVLGCSRYSNAPEMSGKDDVSSCTLVRLRYAAILHRKTGVPIVVSGGSVFDEPLSEAELMQRVLVDEFGVNVILIEDESRNTMENAEKVAELLKDNNIEQVLLVTHAVHMLRAEFSFNSFGVEIIPAPTYFYSRKDNKPDYFEFLPSIKSFYISSVTLYEMFGYIWIKL
jgi:uncharacterized SAM-binding protein YcdF (DUF218 family)